MSKFDNDGFQIITKKRFSRNKPTRIPEKNIEFHKEEPVLNVEKSKLRILSAVEDLQGSKYLQDLSKSVSTLVETSKVTEIVCFGLGHITECNIAKYQLALLLCLKDILKPGKVLVHDPIFYKSECEVLKALDLDVIEQNQEGSYIISEQEITLVYLPHCPKQLTNNFLWSNWGSKLQNCLLICNSFSSLIENQPSRYLSKIVPYIFNIFPHITETLIENNFTYTDIFNDTSIHKFPKENLEKLSKEFWVKGEKPEYNNTEEFITSLMVEKLNI